jgi:hypothetical protein
MKGGGGGEHEGHKCVIMTLLTEIWDIIFIFLMPYKNILITCKMFQNLWGIVKNIRFKIYNSMEIISIEIISIILKKAQNVQQLNLSGCKLI